MYIYIYTHIKPKLWSLHHQALQLQDLDQKWSKHLMSCHCQTKLWAMKWEWVFKASQRIIHFLPCFLLHDIWVSVSKIGYQIPSIPHQNYPFPCLAQGHTLGPSQSFSLPHLQLSPWCTCWGGFESPLNGCCWFRNPKAKHRLDGAKNRGKE